jgi:DNA-binding MltR family transcriptional regulator
MDSKLTPKQMLCETMYIMFKDNHLPYLDMEDFVAMWQSLADKWNIYANDDQWQEFTEEINCVASNRHNIFTEIFDKHFNN